jgi:hypothetical protein
LFSALPRSARPGSTRFGCRAAARNQEFLADRAAARALADEVELLIRQSTSLLWWNQMNAVMSDWAAR